MVIISFALLNNRAGRLVTLGNFQRALLKPFGSYSIRANKYLCLARSPGEAFKLFVGGYAPRSRKIRQDENYDALLFSENDNKAIQDWLDQTGWSSQTTVDSIKKQLKTL
jgi:hypothetical protein